MNYKKTKEGARKETIAQAQKELDMQRAEEIGDELTISTEQFIRDRLMRFWNIPAFLIGTNIKILVNLRFDGQGRLLKHSILELEHKETLEPGQEETVHISIDEACTNPGFNLFGLDPKELMKIEKNGLEIQFDPNEDVGEG